MWIIITTTEISDKLLSSNLKEHVFYVNGKLETKTQRNERLLFYQLIHQSVKHHPFIIRNIVIGDVKEIWDRCSTIGQPNHISLLQDNTEKLTIHKKYTNKTFHTWYEELIKIFEELELVNMPLTENIRIAYFLSLLKNDHRYIPIIKHIELNNIKNEIKR